MLLLSVNPNANRPLLTKIITEAGVNVDAINPGFARKRRTHAFPVTCPS
jgi:hypothetical protein